MHRVTVTDQHYNMVRQYMVSTKLPHVRAAVERMIEIAAVEAAEGGKRSLHSVENGHTGRQGIEEGQGDDPKPSHQG